MGKATDDYLFKMKKSNTSCKVFLSNGVMLTGLIRDFDEESIILDECLIQKRQIISIDPEKRKNIR